MRTEDFWCNEETFIANSTSIDTNKEFNGRVVEPTVMHGVEKWAMQSASAEKLGKCIGEAHCRCDENK